MARTRPDHRLQRLAHDQEMLDPATELALGRQARGGSGRALERLVRSHLRLVYTIACEHRQYGCSFDDVFAEGCVGLVIAARRFDPERGVRFAAYAAWWIRAYARAFTLRHRRIVTTPSSRSARHLVGRIRPAQERAAQRRGGSATIEEVARDLGADPAEVAAVERAFFAVDVSLGQPGGGAGLTDPGASPEEQAAEAEERCQRRDSVAAALATLDDRERTIIEQRLLHEPVSTLASIAEHLGVSWQRVRQLEQRAIEKLARCGAWAA